MLSLYQQIRKKTEEIVAPLETEDYVAQPITDVSPPKWHLGHTTWFFENFILKEFKSDYTIFDSGFAFIFNSYYESQGERILRNKRGTLTSPSTAEIFNYRKYVDAEMEKLLSSEATIKGDLLRFLEIGLNHEQQHQELLITDIKYILGCNPLLPSFQTYEEQQVNPIKPEWLAVEEGVYAIGYEGPSFHFDNEEGVHNVYLHAFEASNKLVTNGEYLEFINDNGYNKTELWLMEGWEWVLKNEAFAPFYWFTRDDKWYNYQTNGVQKVKLDAPVTHVNFYEADAYARWKKCRLLTEFEWEVLAQKHGQFSNDNHFQERNQFQPSAAMDNQLFGTAWEWTNSAYLPYPYYQQEQGALGEYNGKFMINQMVLRGGSCATPSSHFRPTYRNFFHPHLQWQFTGIRLARYSNK